MIQPTKKLDDEGLKRLQILEKKLGCCIVALEHQPPTAALSEDQIKELQATEKETNSVLIAYKC